MEVRQNALLEILGAPDTQFRVPPFQRVYSWTDRQCEDLWNDAMRAGAAGKPHFAGTFLQSLETDGFEGVAISSIIDGQQRMTTLVLMLVAFADWLQGASYVTADGADAATVRNRFLLTRENGACKLMLSHLDRDTLAAAVYGDEPPAEASQRISDIRDLFSAKMRDAAFDAECLWRGLHLLQVINVRLTGEDRPQAVFESLNAKGMRLAAGDLVRNAVLEAAGGRGEQLCALWWDPLEELCATCSDPVETTDLVTAWLARVCKGTFITSEQEVYSVFKRHLARRYEGSLEQLLADVMEYGTRFVQDDAFRAKELAESRKWTSGKPRGSVSVAKLFGD